MEENKYYAYEDYDAVIEEAESEYVTLTPGIYDFEVKSFERTRFAGSDKMPACPEVDVTFGIIDPVSGKQVSIVKKFFLYSGSYDLFPFFVSIGLAKKGEKLKMNWAAVTGRKGRCEINNRQYNGNNYNNIKKFIATEQSNQSSPSQSWGGSF